MGYTSEWLSLHHTLDIPCMMLVSFKPWKTELKDADLNSSIVLYGLLRKHFLWQYLYTLELKSCLFDIVVQ